MQELFTELVPLALSGAFIPFPILVTTIHLASKHPIANAFSFVLGYHAFRFLLGFLGLALLRAWVVPGGEPSSASSLLRVLLGAILILLAVGSLLKPASADALFESLFSRVRDSNARTSFVTGFVPAVVGPAMANARSLAVFVAGLHEILRAEHGFVSDMVALFVLIGIMSVGLLIPIAIYVLAPKRGGSAVAALTGWMLAHDRAVSFVALVIVGVRLLTLGTGGLWK